MKSYEEIVNNPRISKAQQLGFMNVGEVRLPCSRVCSVVWSEDEGGYEHVSVAPRNKKLLPTWNDMCVLKDIFFSDEEEAYQIHPKKSEYVDLKSNCLHLWKPRNHELTELVDMKN